MPQNKNALIRYKTIDKCLQNHYRKWTLEDLITACSDALYEFEGKNVPISKRTVQLDIQIMRSEKLGYNAPIEVYDRKYYRYAEDGFTITDTPLNESDIDTLTEAVSMLKQFKDFSLFSDVSDIVQRLEDKIYSEKNQTRQVIHFDKNEQLKGLHFLDEIYQAIIKKVVLVVTYQSFTARDANTFVFHPFALKEFNNRWFMLGKRTEKNPVQNLALDRIIRLDFDFKTQYIEEEFDLDAHFDKVYGVTVSQSARVRTVTLKVNSGNAPYVLTKPLHRSQKLEKEFDDRSIIITICVQLNFELERLILGFGDAIEVLGPPKLRNRISEKLKLASGKYG
ncbi:MAG: WYL domain-containing protein [Cryomorphaceae bacterium]|nr:WYL domain-containing protein [Cryomorphaceae bacterium]